jgi:hypothetical protein
MRRDDDAADELLVGQDPLRVEHRLDVDLVTCRRAIENYFQLIAPGVLH